VISGEKLEKIYSFWKKKKRSGEYLFAVPQNSPLLQNQK
jgi:hypothetical protein